MFIILIAFIALGCVFETVHEINLETTHVVTANFLTTKASNLIAYAELINNYLDSNPIQNGTIDNSLLPLSSPKIAEGLSNIIENGRLMIYVKNQPGLISNIFKLTDYTALLCVAKNGQLIDIKTGQVMLTKAPTIIPNGYLVYLN